MEDVVMKHALLNAAQFNGKANEKAVLGKVLADKPEFRKDIKKLAKMIKTSVKDINNLSLDDQKDLLKKYKIRKHRKKKQREGLPKLPNVKKGKKIIMRLAPYPSGPLHIGNAKQFIINDWYVKKYGGKLILFIDDTIGSAQKSISKDSYKLIPEGLKWLGIKFDKKVYYKSDRLDIYYKYAEQLIKKGKAYVCECPFHELRTKRREAKACIHRKQSKKSNKEKWEKMLKGKYKEGEATLRLKTDMKHPNPAFRDRVLLRISDREHPKTKKKYKVWPLLEFSWAIDDHLIGVTHIIRGKDLMMESEMERYIWDIFGWEHPEIIHTGFLFIDGISLSKSKSQHEVASGKYNGWGDPRTWSLQSLEKRGLQPEAIKKFILSFSVTEHEVHIPIDKLYSENRKTIDSKAERYFFVSNPMEIQLDKVPVKTTKAPLFPGKRKYRKIPVGKKVFIEKIDFVANRGKEARLMHLANVKLGKKSKVTSKRNKDIPKMHWVSNKAVKIKVVMDNGKVIEGLSEPDIKKVKPGQMVQFERLFFARCNKPLEFYYAHR